MKFVDYVTAAIRSGHGGSGRLSFRRAKFEPMGGPDGGDGGEGGSVIVRGDKGLYTLLDLRYNRHHFAENGGNGGGALQSGKKGEDIVLRVPLGTVIRDADLGSVMGEVVTHGEEVILASGGRGGKGNTFFKSSTNQAPRHFQPGEEGEEFNVTFELKLMADVGLVGFPNAGKSTLVASISEARPKVADYPFTTLVPSLGVVRVGDFQSFVIADIPGIIEGAHEGKGLGIRFLKHIERNAILLFIIPIDADDPAEEYKVLLGELSSFNKDLLKKPRMIGITKTDLLPPDDLKEYLDAVRATLPPDVHVEAFSAVARKRLDVLTHALWERVEAARNPV
ncbi:MAG: GTP-binding protein [Rhodothermales bacterium]|jgi:GTP-binding protein